MEKLEKIFKIISFFDDYRWQKIENYNLINFYSNKLSDDEKLLTHWFCYIMDRQMPFEIIWDVGGFVVSEFVHDITLNKNISVLSTNNKESYLKLDAENKYYMIGKTLSNNLIKEEYPDNIENNFTKFKSRFFPSDYMCILSTFKILEDYDFSISKFIATIYKANSTNEDIIIRIVFSLYLLTYYEIPQFNTSDLSEYKNCLKFAEKRKELVLKIVNNKKSFEKELLEYKTVTMFKQKRAWCSFRDFIKSKEFNKYFRNSMKKYLTESELDNFGNEKSLKQFVLPGDVWNNNSNFRKCIFKNTEFENIKESLNILLKLYHDSKHIKIGYPEQFDITFDFVPRMCEKHNCNICPIEKIEKENDFEKVCISNENKYCGIALAACNYKNNCVGKENCKLIN
jgi:hypothetical protein